MTEIERKKRYRQHRSRILKATSVIDSQAPKSIRNSQEFREMSFIEMMQSLYSKRSQRTFTKSPARGTPKWQPSLLGKFKGNLDLKEPILSLTSIRNKSPDRHSGKGDLKASKEVKKFVYGIPAHILQRYNHLSFIHSPQLMFRLFRPKVYLDLHTNVGQPLGKIVIQLFTEACPEIVLQFVRACMQGQYGKFSFTRLFSPLWVEGELRVDDKNALTGSNVEHDPMAINHGSSEGILSFPSRYLRGSKYRFISFTISFKPIDVLNGKRIAFGKIRKGFNVLDILQNIEVSRSGKPVHEILVTSCGVL